MFAALDNLKLPPIVSDEVWREFFGEEPPSRLPTTSVPRALVSDARYGNLFDQKISICPTAGGREGEKSTLDRLVVKLGRRDRPLEDPVDCEGGGSSAEGEDIAEAILKGSKKRMRKLGESDLSSGDDEPTSLPPIDEYLGWNKRQIKQLGEVTSVSVLFKLYDSVYPARHEEIKVFFAHAFAQYYQIKVCDKRCVASKLRDRVSLEVRKVCDSRFPIFHRFLAYRGFAIQCMFRNLHLYIPDETEKFYSEIRKKDEKLSDVSIRFIKAIIDAYGADLGILNPKDPASVWQGQKK